MSTHSLTIFIDQDDNEVAVVYKHCDGYPGGLGASMKKWGGSKYLVNGLGCEDNVWNGIGCAAASFVAYLKDGPGQVYLYPAGTRDCGQDYLYTLRPGVPDQDGRVPMHLLIEDGSTVYDGLLRDFDPSNYD